MLTPRKDPSGMGDRKQENRLLAVPGSLFSPKGSFAVLTLTQGFCLGI